MLLEKSLFELKDLLEKKEITSGQLTQEYLNRIDTVDSKIKSYISINDQAIKQAQESDHRRAEGQQLSAFDGIPIAIKDNICTKGIKTTCGSKILENFIPPYNATVYEKLRNNGFITLGKTNMDEFAMGSTTETSYFGPTYNPFDTNKVPGGSSGGSAACVASRTAPVSLGSDTGGSIRQPASFCGVVGIKPTYGRVSRFGLVAFASSLDQVGTFGKTVDDAAATLSVIAGHDSKDSTSINKPVDIPVEEITADIKGMKIGVPEEYFQGVNDEISSLINSKLRSLEEMGAIIEKISLKYTEYAIPVYYLIATAEASSNLARYDGVRYGYRPENIANLQELYYKTRSEGFGKEVKRRIILGTYSLSSGYYDAYYLKALKGRTLIINDFKQAFSQVDAIITPVTTTTAFNMGEMTQDPLQMYMSDILTISVNLAGIPGLSLPVGLDSSKMPIGMQIMGNHFEEHTILKIAKAVESVSEKLHPEK